MAKSLGKLVQVFKEIKSSAHALEILDKVQGEMLQKFPKDGMELIKLASTNFRGNKEIFQILESPKYFNAYSDSYFSWYLQLLTDNKQTYMSSQFYEALEEKIIKMTPEQLSWKLVPNALRIFGSFSIVPSIEYTSKLEEVIINNKNQFGLAAYSIIINFYANLRILENHMHKDPDRFRQEMFIKRIFSQNDLEKQSAVNSLIGLTKGLIFLNHFKDTDLWINYFNMLFDTYGKINQAFTPWKISTEMTLLQLIDAHSTFAPENNVKYEEYFKKIRGKCQFDSKMLKTSNWVSPLEQRIEVIFKKYQLKYEVDKIISSYYISDYFIEPNIAIEYDGPIHFLRNYKGENLKMLRGSAVFKTKLISEKGYKVLRIPWYVDNKESYLTTELQKLGILISNF